MPFTASSSGGGDFEIIDAGVYVAVCYCVVDTGTHENATWKKWFRKGIIGFEIPDERIEIEKDGVKKDLPRVVSREFTISLAETGYLRPFLESWRGKKFTFEEEAGFDISKLLGVNCQLNIIHETSKKNGKTYANIATAMPLAKGIPHREPENELIYYSMEDHKLSIPEGVYPWMVKKIEASREFNETGQQNEEWGDQGSGPPINEADDIPF